MDFYYAALSNEKLEVVCEALSEAFGLPSFMYDAHDTWRYAWSRGDHLSLNVTRTEDNRTIETWMPSCPRGVNYQIILKAGRESSNFAARLTAILGADVTKYDARAATEHDEGG
jgi:hypothetical protein